MITLEDYKKEIVNLRDNDEKQIFTQKYFFHGIPKIFENRENDYFHFRKKIADNFKINFYDVMIVGSSKFGFSPVKLENFTIESDVDVVLINERLFDEFYELISEFQYQIKKNQFLLDAKQHKSYVRFLEYIVTGWMRPDLLPQNTDSFVKLKQKWDDFFRGISYSKSEVGNYSVKAGLFKSYYYAEKYYCSSIDRALSEMYKI